MKKMKTHKIILALDEAIFLSGCKTLGIQNIKTNDDIIIWEKPGNAEDNIICIIHWKDIQKTTDYVLTHFISIEKILILSDATIVSNSELKQWDIIIPNTFTWRKDEVIFNENTIGTDYDLKNFGLIVNGICTSSQKNTENGWDDFVADIYSKSIFSYVSQLSTTDRITEYNVILQIWWDDYINLISICDMSL